MHSGDSEPLTDGYMSSSHYLKKIIKEEGIKNFEKIIIAQWDSRVKADAHENKLHLEHSAAVNKLFYNKKNGIVGFHNTDNLTIEYKGSGNPNYNNKMSDKSKNNISIANTGHTRNKGSKRTHAQCQNISKSLIGKRWYHNGIEKIYVFPNDCPNGFKPGMGTTKTDQQLLEMKKINKGKKYFNNGVKNILCLPELRLEGYIPGMKQKQFKGDTQ